MKFSVILIALHLLAASKEINGLSEVKESQRSLHNRLHIHGDRNWALDPSYRFNVMITWKMKAEAMIPVKTESEIGKIKNLWLYYKCSGSIIAPAWVLTAATCFQPRLRMGGKKKETLAMPLPDGLVLSVKQNRSIDLVYIHNDFVETSKRGDIDIALVRLQQQFSTNKATDDYVTVARLGKNLAYSTYVSGNHMRNCKVAGYGEDAVLAEPPFTQKLSLYDVRAAGPKYCEIVYRRYVEPWYNELHPMNKVNDEENDMFDSYFVCTTPHEWAQEGDRVPHNEEGLGCFGMVGASLTCDDQDVLIGIQSERFEARDSFYCSDDDEAVTTFTSVGQDKVHDWIKDYGPDLEPLVPLQSTDFSYEYRNGDDTNSTSSTTVSTCGGLVLTLALTTTAFTF